MKAITLYPEWAWAICHLDKRVENRKWPLPGAMAGQLVALHAGKHPGGRPGHAANTAAIESVFVMAERAGWAAYRRLVKKGNTTGYLALLERNGETHTILCPCSSIVAFLRFGPSHPPFEGNLMGWRAPDQHGWPIVEVLRLKEPVPVERGALGFWELPPAILRRCQEVGTVEDEQLPLFGGV